MAAKKKTAVKEITVKDTFFMTDKLTMDPENIQTIVANGSQITVHTYSDKPIQVPAEKDENDKPLELEVYTDRWALALENKKAYDLQKLEKELDLRAEPR